MNRPCPFFGLAHNQFLNDISRAVTFAMLRFETLALNFAVCEKTIIISTSFKMWSFQFSLDAGIERCLENTKHTSPGFGLTHDMTFSVAGLKDVIRSTVDILEAMSQKV